MTKQIKISQATFENLLRSTDELDISKMADGGYEYVSIFDREGLELACGTYHAYQPSTFYKNSRPALHSFGRWDRVEGDFECKELDDEA